MSKYGSLSTDELAARTIRCLSKTADPHWHGAYHASLDLLASRTVRKLTSMQRSLQAAATSEQRFEIAERDVETSDTPTDLLRAMLDMSTYLAALRPALQDLSELVSELRDALQLLADAEDLSSHVAKAEAEARATEFVVRLLQRLSGVDPETLESIFGVVELVLETAVMLSARPSCLELFREAGGLEVLVRMLDSQDYGPMLDRGAIALANLSESALNRYHLRRAGAMPVLVSLAGDAQPDDVRVSAATAIAIMCCTDQPCQDALRHADGITQLVKLANSRDLKVAQVAKLALDCATDGNRKNLSAMEGALREQQRAFGESFSRATRLLGGGGSLDGPHDEERARTAPAGLRHGRAAAAPRGGWAGAGTCPPLGLSSRRGLQAGDLSPRSEPSPLTGSPFSSPRRSALSTPPSTPPTHRYRSVVERTASPRGGGGSPVRDTVSILRSSLRSASAADADASSDEEPPRLPRRDLDTARATGRWSDRRQPAATRLLAARRPPSELTPEQVCELAMEMGCGTREARALRDLRIGGEEMLDLTEDEMRSRLGLAGEAVAAVQAMQRASEMFDRMARTSMQGKLSELEFRVFLATQGLRATEISGMAESFRELDDFGDGSVSFWDWAKAYKNFSRILSDNGVPDVP